MSAAESYTWREIMSQPEVWTAGLERFQAEAGTLRTFWKDAQFDSVAFIGCGSTYYLSLAAAGSFPELTGVSARGIPASEIWLNRRSTLAGNQRTLLIAVSRSGETTETLRAVDAFRAAGRGPVVTLSCYQERALASKGDLNLVLPEAQEQSVAQTRAFSSLYLATVALAAMWADRQELLEEMRRMPTVAASLLDNSTELARELARDESLTRFYFLGSGPRYGLACELSLKMKEMSLSESEPFHFLEFRHGPQSMAGPGTLIVGLVSEANRAHELAVLEEMRGLGARVVAIGERDMDITFSSEVSEAVRGALYLPFGQLLAHERAVWRGLNPDRPHNLSAVVKLGDTVEN